MAEMSSNWTQRHYPPGSGGCTRGVQQGPGGKYQVQKSNGEYVPMDSVIQNAIKHAIANNQDKAIYEFNGSRYYIDLKGPKINSNDSDDESDSDISDVEDLLNDPNPGFPFVGDGIGQKVDIAFNNQFTVLGLKEQFGDKLQCDPDELEILAEVNGEFVEVKHKTLADNKINNLNDLIIFKKDDKKEAIKRLIRAKKWEDKTFRKNAKKWLKDSGNDGKKGLDNLIKKNNLNPGWNDILSKLKYNDVLKIIKDETIMSNIDRARVDESFRQKYNLTKNDVSKLTFSEIQKMAKNTQALRKQFYEDMNKMALNGANMKITTDCQLILNKFVPPMGFFGIISLIDGKEIKLRGLPCKDVDKIKKGQVYIYPSSSHNKTITLSGVQSNGGYISPSNKTGHQQLCDLSGLPPEFCAGFAIKNGTLTFRSGTCNSGKKHKVKGFDNGRALTGALQQSLEKAFKGTKGKQFYNKIDRNPN